MFIILGVGRVGSHVGHLEINQQYFGIENDTQEVTEDTLFDKSALKSLLGIPVFWNHVPGDIGVVRSIETKEGGLLEVKAEITSRDAKEKLAIYKEAGDILETSPSFSCTLELDNYGRVIQTRRKYSELSILTPDNAGRGGPAIRAKYSYSLSKGSNMEELIQQLSAKVDALSATITDALTPPEMECADQKPEETAAYQLGYTAGQQQATASYQLHTVANQRAIKVTGDSLEPQIDQALSASGLDVTDKSVTYKYAALEALSALAPSGVTKTSAIVHNADPAQAAATPNNGRLAVRLTKPKPSAK